MVKLGVRVPYHKGESPASFASRLAARNLRPSARHFCLDMGLTFQRIINGEPEALEHLAELGRADLEQMRHAALVHVKNYDFRLNGERLVGHMLQRQALVVCPLCLKTDAVGSSLPASCAMFGRSIWQVKPIRTCPVHNIPLSELRVEVVAHVTHDFAHLIAPFRVEIDRLGDVAKRRDFSAFEGYLTDRLENSNEQRLWLNDLGFSAAARLCEMVGVVSEFGLMPNLTLLTSGEWAQAGSAGFQIVRDGPNAFTDFLLSLQRRPHTEGNIGPKAFFGRLYQWLAFGSDDPELEPVRHIVREHIINTTPVGAGELVLGKPVAARRIHSVSTAAKEYGLHIQTLRKTLHAVGLVPPADAQVHNALAVFDSAKAAPLLKSLAIGVPLLEARRYLNIPRMIAALFAKSGIISPVVKPNGFEAVFDRAHLDDFMARISREAIPVRNPSAPIRNIPLTAKHACCSTVEIAFLLLDGELKWVGRDIDERGFLSILVNSDEVRLKVAKPPLEGIAISDIPDDIGVTYKVVRRLIDGGALTTVMAINPVNRCPQRLVTKETYDRFRSQYISLRDLSRIRGIWSRELRKTLTDQSVLPVEEFRKDGVYLYRRSDVT